MPVGPLRPQEVLTDLGKLILALGEYRTVAVLRGLHRHSLSRIIGSSSRL